MTKRLTGDPYYQTFDGADPNACTADRDQSVTSIQALYFVNDEFLHLQADRLAETALAIRSDPGERIDWLFETILSRAPRPEERELLHEHLAQLSAKLSNAQNREPTVWASLIRSLLRLNEFLYLD